MESVELKMLDESGRREIGERWSRVWSAWYRLIDPVLHGHEHVSRERPALWVGNHSLMAFADAGLMVKELYDRHGIVVRGLGQHVHFKIPVWGEQMLRNGVVDGTRENCAALMNAGEHILVYPGGGGEVMKRDGEQHTLRWKSRTGFARLAIENDYPIQPFATVGADDCWDIVYDNNRFGNNRLAGWLSRRTGLKLEELPPLLKGWGPTLLPKPERMYFRFFEQISPAEYRDMPIEDGAKALRSRVEQVVREGMAGLLLARAADPDNLLRKRLFRKHRR